MSSSPEAEERKQHPNRGMLQIIALTVIATVSIILFASDAWLAVTLSAIVMAIIVGVVFLTISSILFVGLKDRNIFLATAMVGVAIASIISLFAEIFVWIGNGRAHLDGAGVGQDRVVHHAELADALMRFTHWASH